MSENGRLQVDVTANASGFQQTMRQVSAHAKKASGEITGELGKSWSGAAKGFLGGIVGAFSFEAIKGSLEGFLDKAKYIRDLSEQMDMGADATQRWAKSAENAGFSFGTMQAALTAINSKRQEAMTDPKAAKIFEDMGIPREKVRDTKGTDNSEFARLILDAAGKGDANRALLESIVGKRGAGKAIAASREFGSTTADIGEDSMAVAQNAEESMRTAKSFLYRKFSEFVGAISDTAKQVGDASIYMGRDNPNSADADHINYGRLPMPARNTSPPKDEIDEAELRKKEKEKDRAERDLISADRIEAAKRQNMTAAEKRASLEKELEAVKARRAAAEKEQAPDYLDQVGREDELADWKAKQNDKIADLTVREQGLIGDLKDKVANPRPFGADANALSKSGLFTGSTTGGPDSALSYARETVATLKSIEKKMGLDSNLSRD